MDKYELPEFERRFFSRSNEGLEIRAAGDGDLPKIVTLQRTNSDTVIAGLFVERIERGAFSRAIREGHDVRALFNHDPNQVLARTKNKTLTLRETEEGLESEADPADTSYARDLVTLLKRGDVDQASFAFRVTRQEWVEEGAANGMDLRIIKDLDLFDTSVVTYPAYDDAEANVRAQGCAAALAEYRAWKESRGLSDAERMAMDAARQKQAEAELSL